MGASMTTGRTGSREPKLDPRERDAMARGSWAGMSLSLSPEKDGRARGRSRRRFHEAFEFSFE